jgi:hypothetical protein
MTQDRAFVMKKTEVIDMARKRLDAAFAALQLKHA